jgi:hypothetical protein
VWRISLASRFPARSPAWAWVSRGCSPPNAFNVMAMALLYFDTLDDRLFGTLDTKTHLTFSPHAHGNIRVRARVLANSSLLPAKMDTTTLSGDNTPRESSHHHPTLFRPSQQETEMLKLRLRCLTDLKPSQTKVNEPSVCSKNGLEDSAQKAHF